MIVYSTHGSVWTKRKIIFCISFFSFPLLVLSIQKHSSDYKTISGILSLLIEIISSVGIADGIIHFVKVNACLTNEPHN
jgi:hypothetical protein